MTDRWSPSSPWRALRHRNFALFAAGHGVSLCGSWMQGLAQAWLVYRLTESPLLLDTMEFLARAPILFLSLAAGLVADRVPRHRLMVLTQILLLLQAATLVALTLTGLVTVSWILALALLMGLISALEIPIRQTFMTDLVPPQDIPSAIGLNALLFNAARIVGPSFAGVLAGTVGEGPCFLINALSSLVVLGCLKAMRIAPLPPHQSGNAARRSSVTGRAASICRAMTRFGGSPLLFAASPSVWLSIPALAAIGFAMVGTLAASNTLLQSLAANGMRGRVVSG